MKRSVLQQFYFVAAMFLLMTAVLITARNAGMNQSSLAASLPGWRPALMSDRRAGMAMITAQLKDFDRNDYEDAYRYFRLGGLQADEPNISEAYVNQNFPEIAHYECADLEDAQANRDGNALKLRVRLIGKNGRTVRFDYTMIVYNGKYYISGWRSVDGA